MSLPRCFVRIEDEVDSRTRRSGWGGGTTLTTVVSEGTVMGFNEETGEMSNSVIDAVAVPVFRGLLNVIQFAKDFAPIDAVSTGRSIPWGTVGMAGFQIVLVLGGVSALLGMFLFTRRELATAQGNQ